MAELRQLATQRLDLRSCCVVLDERADGVGVVEHVAAVPGDEFAYTGAVDGTDQREREVDERPLEPRPGEDAEGVALADAPGEQAVRERVDTVPRLGPGDLVPAAVHARRDTRGRRRAGARRRPATAFRSCAPPAARPSVNATWQGDRAGARRTGVPGLHLSRCEHHLERSLSFGLVTIPVGLAPATKPAARQSDVSFRLLHRECLTPIKQKRWCPHHDHEVGTDEIVRGWEVSKGAVRDRRGRRAGGDRAGRRSRAIEISRFVPLEEVDPIWFDRTYFLVPGAAAAQRRPYALLLEAMRETAIGARRPLRPLAGSESLCLVRLRGEALVLETLFVSEDVYSQAEIDEAVKETEDEEPELELARQIVDGLAGPFDPAELASDYRRDLRAVLEAKLRGETIVEPEPVAERPGGRPHGGARASVAAAKASPAKAKAAAKPAAGRAGAQGRPEERPHATRRRSASQSSREALGAAACAAPTPASCAWNRVLSILPW